MASKRSYTPPAKEVLPHQEEAERAVLAGLMLDENFVPLVRTQLSWEDFFFERHQLIYQSCLRLVDRGKPVDSVTVLADLESSGLLSAAGGLAYLTQIDVDLPDLSRVPEYAQIVSEFATRRDLIGLAGRTITRALEPGLSTVEQLLERTEKDLRILSAGAASAELVPIAATVRETVAAVEDRHDRGAKELFGLPTGLRDFDRLKNGLVDGELVLVAGRPGHGKTSFALAVLEYVVIILGRPAALYNLEMSVGELTLRLISRIAGVPFERLRSGLLSQRQWASVHEAERRLAAAPLYISDEADTGIAGFCAGVRRLHSEQPAGQPLAVAMLDYLQLAVPGGERGQEHLDAAGRSLKLLARELEMPVVALSQLSREPERRSDGRPKLSDLRGSGSLEQHADAVVFCHRPEEYDPENSELRGVADLILGKHRNGRTGDVRVAWEGETMAFRNLDRGEAPW